MAYYHGKGQGAWIRDRFIEVGDKGITAADLFKERQERWSELGLPHGGTYNSFAKYFSWYKQLSWIEPTTKIEPATPRGVIEKLICEARGVIHRYILKDREQKEILGLSPRVYYKIKPEGLAHNDKEWGNPLIVCHPEWAPGGVKKREYMREYMKEYRRKKRELLVRFGFAPHPQGRPRFSSGER